MEAAVNWICLPDEILEIIFSYCTHSDLVQSIQNVCCQWREVAQSTKVWKDVTYCPEYYTRSEQVVEMLKISPKLQNVVLQNYDDEVLEAITENCAELRKLEMGPLPGLGLNFLKNLQEKCLKVEFLKIPHPILKGLDQCEVVGKFTNLKVLHLTGDPATRSSVILKPVADHCKKLEHLDLQTGKFEMNDLHYLLSMKKDTLHTVAVRCCNESGECVLPAVSTCELKSLSLFYYCHCQRHYEKVEHFGQLKTLRTLSITEFYSRNESQDPKQIFENGNMAHLVKLKIKGGVLRSGGSHYFDDAAAEVIVRNCPLLKHLSLISCSDMTDVGLKNITNLKELNSLTISGNHCVTDTGIFYLQDVKCLKYLKISWCKVGLRNIVKLSTLQDLTLEFQDLAGFPWDLIPDNMKYLQYLRIYYCRNVNACSIEKLKTVLPWLKVKVKDH